MSTLADYTNPIAVRAALGVSTSELPDSTFTEPNLLYALELDLESVYVDLPTIYATALAAPTPTSQEARLLRLVSLYSSYVVASQFLHSLMMHTTKSWSDGRAEVVRHNLDESSLPTEGIKMWLAKYRALLRELLAAMGYVLPVTNVVKFTPAGLAGLAVDPVTGVYKQ